MVEKCLFGVRYLFKMQKTMSREMRQKKLLKGVSLHSRYILRACRSEDSHCLLQ